MVGVGVVLRRGHYVSLRELRAAARSALEPRWLPGTVVYLDEVRKDASGEPMRVGLAAHLGLPDPPGESHARTLDGDRLDARPNSLHAPASRPPSGELLDVVLDAVRTHTRDEHVGADVPLMDAGLTSLSATQLVQHLSRAWAGPARSAPQGAKVRAPRQTYRSRTAHRS